MHWFAINCKAESVAAPLSTPAEPTPALRRKAERAAVVSSCCGFLGEVTLTDSQWEEHTTYFDRLLNEVASEQADAPGSIVLRGALMVARIASIFTALRKYEGAMRMKEYICTDEDFHAAMQIVQTTLNHSLLVSSSLPGDEVKSKPLKSYFRIRTVVELSLIHI